MGGDDAKYHPQTLDELKKLVKNKRIYLGDIDTSAIINMDSLFSKSKRKDYSGIENWDVSNVESMYRMFANARYFNADLSNWNVSKVKNMKSMFAGTGFNQDISKWNVSNVEEIQRMFQGAKSFNQDLSKWNTKNLTCTQTADKTFEGSKIESNPPKWFVDYMEKCKGAKVKMS